MEIIKVRGNKPKDVREAINHSLSHNRRDLKNIYYDESECKILIDSDISKGFLTQLCRELFRDMEVEE